MQDRDLPRRSRPGSSGPGLALLALALVCACAARGARSSGPRAAPPAAEPVLQAVIAIHGGAGPWAVAGYRMGRYALRQLGLERGSWDLEVVHHSPREVQYACIADGAAAATGASVGRLNLSMVESAQAETRTTFRRRSTGRSITVRVTSGFARRFEGLPRAELARAGREVAHLPEEQIFQEGAHP